MKVIYHMLTTLDGKISGKVLEKCDSQSQFYYKKHKEYNADAFMCGRVTMQTSFCGTRLPYLTGYGGVVEHHDHVHPDYDFYAVSIDTHGRCNWKDNVIHDEDSGYDGAHIIEVLCDNTVNDAYLSYLDSIGVSYIFAGKDKINLKNMLRKLEYHFHIHTLLLEGGGILGGTFAEKHLIDELSLVVAPFIAGNDGQDLFVNHNLDVCDEYELVQNETIENGLYLNYKRK